jgi:hypothetical protein
VTRALILDFGGVVTRTLFETHDLSEAALALEPGTLTWCGPFDPESDPLWQDMQADRITERDYWMQRTREVGALVGKDWTKMADFVRAARGGDPDAVIRPEFREAIPHRQGSRHPPRHPVERARPVLRRRFPRQAALPRRFRRHRRRHLHQHPEARSARLSGLPRRARPAGRGLRLRRRPDAQHRGREIRRPSNRSFRCLPAARKLRGRAAIAGYRRREHAMKDSNFLKENNARHMWHPMAHPADSLANPPKIIVGGEGVRITDVDGKETLDAVGGLWNVNLGFSCEPVKEAIAAQLDALPYYSTFRGTSNDAADRTELKMLRDFFAPDGLTRAFFTSGGSDSVETALRLARQYHKVRGEPGRMKYLSLKKGYHGTHFGGASVNGNANFRTQYEPLLPGCLPHPGALHLSQPVQRDRSGESWRSSALIRAGRRDRLPGRGHHRRLHHGAGARRRRRHPAA